MQRWVVWARVGTLGFAFAATVGGCRSCAGGHSPDAGARTPARAVTGVNARMPLRPERDASTSTPNGNGLRTPTDDGPGTAPAVACPPLGADVQDVQVSLANLVTRYGVAARAPLEGYILCASVATPAMCDRLPTDDVGGCHMAAEQLAARAARATGWALTPAMARACAGRGADEAGCRRWAEAVEAGDPSRCTGLPAGVYCEAAASGDPSRCPAGAAAGDHASCERFARNYAALRTGVEAVEHGGDPRRAAAAAGARMGAAGCQERLRAAYTEACVPHARQPTP